MTGAGSGIGLATCGILRSLDFDVVGAVAPGEVQGIGRLRAEAAGPGSLDVLEADLGDPAAREGLAEGLDLWALVNNAGYMNAGQLRDVPLPEARRQLEAMVVAPVDLCRQAAPAMIARGHGRIVNVTSSALSSSTPLTGWYQACKAALREITDSLRVELAPYGVAVIDVEPGGYRTGIWGRAASELAARRDLSDRPDLYDRALRRLGSGYEVMGDPSAVALCVADALTTGSPRRHIRVGPGARVLRAADRLVPDAVWDRVVAGLAGMPSQVPDRIPADPAGRAR